MNAQGIIKYRIQLAKQVPYIWPWSYQQASRFSVRSICTQPFTLRYYSHTQPYKRTQGNAPLKLICWLQKVIHALGDAGEFELMETVLLTCEEAYAFCRSGWVYIATGGKLRNVVTNWEESYYNAVGSKLPALPRWCRYISTQ